MMKYEPPKQTSTPKTTKRKQTLTMSALNLKLTLYRFYAQVFFSCVVVGLSVWQLATKEDFASAERAIYWSSLSGTVANWLPSPLEKVDTGKRKAEDEDEEDDDKS